MPASVAAGDDDGCTRRETSTELTPGAGPRRMTRQASTCWPTLLVVLGSRSVVICTTPAREPEDGVPDAPANDPVDTCVDVALTGGAATSCVAGIAGTSNGPAFGQGLATGSVGGA